MDVWFRVLVNIICYNILFSIIKNGRNLSKFLAFRKVTKYKKLFKKIGKGIKFNYLIYVFKLCLCVYFSYIIFLKCSFKISVNFFFFDLFLIQIFDILPKTALCDAYTYINNALNDINLKNSHKKIPFKLMIFFFWDLFELFWISIV